MPAVPGQMLSHYRLIEEIGKGGMGIVWKAWDEHLDREIAIKLLPPGMLADDSARQRFRKEARALSRINHPNIATVHDFDTQDDLDFLVMEYIPGITLSDRLAEGPLEEREVLSLGMQLMAGLAAAHDHGILHRDLKPGNLRLTPDDRLKILDFGLAKLIRPLEHDEPTETMTRADSIVGTLAYMAPEQLRGEELDERTDIYAAGSVLYELATGVRIHSESQRVQLIDSILHGAPKPPSHLRTGFSREFERVILKAAGREPRARHNSARELAEDLEKLSGNAAPHGSGSLLKIVIAAALLAAVVSAAWIVPNLLGRFSTTQTDPERTRIVVLPFENLGPADHAYFADGVTEEITSRLASVGGLGVISRKSAIHYALSDKTIRQIGAELDVSYVLEGTVRWAHGAEGRERVMIRPKLIRVADDTHVWANSYDQLIDDIFEVQSLIARKVVQQLGIALQERERAAVEIRPTENLDAYHAYLRGLHHASQPHFTVSNWQRALESFQQAVTLDPDFTKAWRELSRAHALFYFYQVDASDERKRLAREAANRAVELEPETAETHLALGYYYHWVERDTQRALDEFALAERGLPNNAGVLQAQGTLLQAMGRWREAQAMMEKALVLSPRDASMTVDLAFLYYLTRQYEKALEFSERSIALAPSAVDQTWGHLAKMLVHWSWDGDLAPARAALEHVPLKHDFAIWAWFWQEMYEGRYREADEQLQLAPEGWIRNKIGARPAPLFSGLALDAMGNAEGALTSFESARSMLEEALEKEPDDARLHSSLGITYAAMGRKDEALLETARAIELYPLSRDAFYGLPYLVDQAHIYVLLGDHDAACESLEYLISIPSWISPAWLQMDPRWDPLCDSPCFQRLLR